MRNRPSKRPSVKQVVRWNCVYSDEHDRRGHWRGDQFTGTVIVEEGYPFPDFYRVLFFARTGGKTSSLFYGETAWSDVERYVYDLGFPGVLGKI